jgi:L-asparaginase II
MANPDEFAPIAITNRSGYDESVHFGAVVGLAPDGDLAVAIGDPDVTVYPRSSTKPLQAAAMVRNGLRLPAELLALVCGSHNGTARHVEAARQILATVGLDERSLGNPADLPLDRTTAEEVLRTGGGRTALQMNCSGKHGGMLVTSAINQWPVDASYLNREHPLQLRVTDTVGQLAGEQCSHIGVDGCGLPAHVISLVGLARAYRAIAMADEHSPDGLVYSAMTAHPEMVGGDGRDVTKFMRHVPGLMAKDGAEGVYAAALPDGRAVALKVADGGNRARPAVMVAALRALGVDISAVEPLVTEWMLGHGQHVGEVRAIAP